MCGLVGFLDLSAVTPDRADVVGRMADTLAHRGPDDRGLWADDAAGIALGHRRLSIVELSPLGAQPMMSQDQRWVIAFNGEIYNHHDMRRRLDLVAWRGHSDTETLVEAIARWGVEKTLALCDGMFAFAAWDRTERALILARDRFGEKPLYWSECNGTVLFASELKALRQHPAFDTSINRNALGLYMKMGWVPAPHTIYAHASKLMPGTFLRIQGQRREERAFWSSAERARNVAGTFTGGASAAAERLNQLLRSSITLRMQADVPVGVFLSGGIDSSLTAAIMQSLSSSPVHTFTIGFDQTGYDESPYAKSVATYLGTIHHETRITDEDALALVPDLPRLWDEPFADPAQLPTALLAQVTRKQVTVALSGDGADEIFGGYGIYRSLPRDWERLAASPSWMRRLGAIGRRLPVEGFNAVAALASLGRNRRSYPGYRLRKTGEMLGASSLPGLMGLHYQRWRGMPSPVLGATATRTVFTDPPTALNGLDPSLQTMVLDMLGYLPDDLCVKTDRATMAYSLEARLPFLDPAIVEFGWSLPTALKIGPATGKMVLREVLYGYVPRPLVDRPKMGFEVPIGRWLQGKLRDWADDLLSEDLLKRQGWLNAPLIARCWRDHRSGTKSWQTELWHVLMFQSWLNSNDSAAVPR